MPVVAEPFDCRLVSARPLTPSVRELVFERVDDRPMAFAPGQWVNLVIPLPEGEIKRAYSIASAPEAGSSRFALAVTHVTGGPGSTYLHALSPGATLRAIGPQGLFTRDATDQSPSLFVATGTGITPFRSMIEAANNHLGDKAPPMTLLFGVRHEGDILYREDMSRWAEGGARVAWHVTLSRPHEGWAGKQGWVQTHVPSLLADLAHKAEARGLGAPHVYVCGLDRMVSAVRELLRNSLGVDRKRVHTERYD